MTLYARQQKRHRCKEQTFGLCGRRWGWDDLREQHWNMYITTCETDHQSRFDAWDRALRAGALGRPWGMGWGGRWEGGSGWGTHVHPWLIHVNVWQKPLQYCKVISLQFKWINFKKQVFKRVTYLCPILSLQCLLLHPQFPMTSSSGLTFPLGVVWWGWGKPTEMLITSALRVRASCLQTWAASSSAWCTWQIFSMNVAWHKEMRIQLEKEWFHHQ